MPGAWKHVEPWLQGTRADVPPAARAVLHALDLARDDFARWVWPLAPAELEATPFRLPSVAFHARHIVRSLDRLLTYAEGDMLSTAQAASLHSESAPENSDGTRIEFESGLMRAEARIRLLPLEQDSAVRSVGRERLPVTLMGLVVHLADHTQRHAGQAVTTAKLLLAIRSGGATGAT